MADVYMGVDIQTAQTTAASSTFSPWTGFGTPKGAILFGSNATALGSSTVNAKWSVGVYDGTSQFCCAASHQNSVTTTAANRTAFDDRICGVLANTGGSITGEGTASWATDGLSVDYTPDPYPTAQQQVALLFGGADMRCKAVKCFFDMAKDAASSSQIASLSFAPKAVVFIGNRTQIDSNRPTGPNIANDARMFVGFAAQVGASIVQGSYNYHASDGVSALSQVVGGIPSNTYALHPIADNATPALVTDAAFEVTEFGADYIEVTKRVDSTDHYVIALVLGGVDFHAAYKATPTTATTQSVTGLAFDPLGLLSIATMSAGTMNAIDSSTAAGTFGFGASGSPSATNTEGSVSISLDSAASPTSTLSHAKGVAVYVSNPADSDKCDATVNGGSGSWGSSQWTTDFTNVIGSTARHAWYLAMERSVQTPTLGAASSTASAQALTVAPGALTVPLGAASSTASALALSAAPGALSVSLGAATATATAAAATCSSSLSVALGAASATAVAPSLTVGLGALTVSLGAAVATATGGAITVVLPGTGDFYYAASNAVRSKWYTDVEVALSLPTQYDNLPEFTKPNTVYARTSVEFEESDLAAFGGRGMLTEARGVLRARIFQPALQGSKPADDLVDGIVAAFEDVRDATVVGDDVVRFFTPRVVGRSQGAARYVVELEVPFLAEDTAANAAVLTPALGLDRQEVGEALRGLWESAVVTGLSLPTQYDGQPFSRPDNSQWARVVIREGEAQHVEVGRTRVRGVFMAQVFTPSETGEKPGLQLVDAINRAFRHRNIQGLRTLAPSVSAGVRSGPWHQFTVSIPWEADRAT